jgi:flavin reductase (DIM6/NTAB) family NADH-FMN oxidoreductase RutF
MKDADELLRSEDPLLWIVTARSGKSVGGLVATFVSSASIVSECPRVVVGLARTHHTWQLVEETGAFALHLFTEDRMDWVRDFGMRSGREHDKLAGLNWHGGATGSPLLDDALGWLDCRVETQMETGDRTVYLAEVVDARVLNPGKPLTLKRLPAIASAEELQELKRQRAEDAVFDAEVIRMWRAMRAHSPSRAGKP